MDYKNIDRLWPHIHWLNVLAEQGSFTSAARRLAVSKAAMSQRVAELEAAAGVPLVLRTTRSVRLTDAGRQLVDDTRDAYLHIAQSFAEVRDLSTTPAGLLRITAPVAFARQQLVACLPEFMRRHPRIRLELDMRDSLVSLTSEGFDLALRHIEVPPDTYVARVLCPTRALLLASPAYLARQGTPRNPGDLKGHSQLHYPRQQGVANWVFQPGRAASPAASVTVPIQPCFVANNSEVLRDMACAGLGIAVLPDFSAQQAVREGALVPLLPDWRPVNTFGRTIFALRPYSARAPRNVRVLLDYLLEVFAGGFDGEAAARSS
ncbi:LysR family transcriptional regulator [Castellaniella hirudinis]|uniref:LysR family transcriptional regulator n=1 Tax=Castellaniella hirudinis TaxID=1144617 RepID=UPI0039C22274